MIEINKKIASSKVVAAQAASTVVEAETQKVTPEFLEMHEAVERPEILLGSTYKVKYPGNEHALYITINDIVLNSGTDHELRQPFEIFVNSKSMDNFQWITALTRVISAVFRKGGDIAFLVDELLSVFDPKGGHFKKGHGYVPSVVAEIGIVIRDHMNKIGLIKTELDKHQVDFINKKKSEVTEKHGNDALKNAMICPSCNQKTAIMLDNCLTCLSCSMSKCG